LIRMRYILRFFSLLDVISIALLSKQVYSILSHIHELSTETLSVIKIILILVIYPLLFASAIGLFMQKKWGSISYYIQFPLRLIVWVFSFGFLTFISEYYPNPLLFDWIFRLVIILEFFRLYFTVQAGKRL
jgi:hypothetical protein